VGGWVSVIDLGGVELVEVSPAEATPEDIESGDGPVGEGDGVVIVELASPVVGRALEPSVELAGGPALVAGDDVVDVAVRGGDIAARGVLAVAVTHFDGAT
jgi:hypothetical protein